MVDILAWHAARRVVLVVELKTEIPDPAGLIAQVDRYRRLAPEIARDRGWNPAEVAAWVLVAESDMNRRQLARHRAMLRNAFPLDGRALRRWLRDPGMGQADADGARGIGDVLGVRGGPSVSGVRGVSGLAFLANVGPSITNRRLGPTRRVRARPNLANASSREQSRGRSRVQAGSGDASAAPRAPDFG